MHAHGLGNNTSPMTDNPAAPLNTDPEHRYLELLVRAGEILSTALDWHETVGAVCDAVVDTIADLCFLCLKDETGALQLVASASAGQELTKEIKEAERFVHGPARRTPLVQEVADNGRSVLVPEVDEHFIRSMSVSPAHERFMRRMKYRSLAVVPVAAKTRGVIGALGLVRTGRSEERYDSRSLRFIEDLARRCGTAISKAMLYEQTLRIATVFQRAALPSALPSIDGIAFDAFYEPSSQDLLVGGDWYDAFALSDGRVAITIGDVLGHGLDAAVWMSRLRNGLRAAMFGDPDPARALEIVDQMLRSEGEEEFFTTALVALVDPVRQTLCCASAGHPGPLIWTGTGEVMDPFRERGLPLGLRHIQPAVQTAQTLNVRAGAFAVFFTDGLLEWNRDIAMTWNAVERAIERQDIREAAHPAERLRAAVIDGAQHQDDVAILTVRWDVETRTSYPLTQTT